MPRVCVVGGGPAGMMTGFLLARAGIETVVLEKHKDFFRDFRGDTMHPSTLELIHELGLLEEFLKLPHNEMSTLSGSFDGEEITIADFRSLPTACKFMAFMPQWDFLNFLAEKAMEYPSFRLIRETEVTDLLMRDNEVVGVRAVGPDGPIDVMADLVVGADGRHSVVRERAKMELQTFGVPIDVLWMKIPKDPATSHFSLGYFGAGKFMVLLDRGEYFQCGYIIPKDGFGAIQTEGIPKFRDDLVSLAPFLRPYVESITDWDQLKLLTVRIDRLRTWAKPGLLCIGDSAHAMSPAGGVGINFAIQDAVATANILTPLLPYGRPTQAELLQVQSRRERSVKWIQSIQVAAHRRFLTAATAERQRDTLRTPKWFLKHVPGLPKLIARIVGLGFRREHVR